MSKGAVGRSPKMIQNVFVLLLLSLFAILSTFLVTVGAQLYRNTVESSEKNNAIRIVTTVLRSTIWAEDGGEGEIKVEKFQNGGQEMKVLSIVRQYGKTKENVWVKRVFVYNGELKEGYNEYYRKIKRKELKQGQRYLEADENPEDAEFEEDDEFWGDELADAGENAAQAADPGGYEEVIDTAENTQSGTDGEYKIATGNEANEAGADDYVYVIRGFNPEEDGEPLCELLRFEPSRDGRLLSVELETVDHQTSTVRMFMRTGGAE